ncbi:uncharacterized protein A1O9_10617 [Exophiala aquamarina CBS 119918]|uniref:Uncharacterized protein n=1 Tax=Exophiala aquamarina CBS 119918 TaxID=1182545 RepID=A0A072NZ56_9EURO|nr:uncharacterized protein A1O9_10617 [Exophiala aquamarina CBS 119918]KEF53169.1 hypothetical protein A1O9_10617 [Exophiala aquamarina CBS 119918]
MLYVQYSSRNGRLEKLIAIPSATSARESGFLRAYPPSLAAFSISVSEFLHFIDTINHVSAKSPPLQVLSLAGNIVGLVPLATTQMVGTAINLGAEVGAAAVTYGRSEMELRKANKELFGPRGLKVEVAKLDAVARLTGMPILNSNGRFNKNIALLKPLDESDMDISMDSRRLEALGPWIAPLEIQRGRPPMPASASQTESKFGQFQARLDEKGKARREKKAVAKRHELQQDYDKDYKEIQSKLEQDLSKREEELAKDLKEIQKDMDKAKRKKKPDRQNEEMEKLERKMAKAVEESENKVAKITREYEKDLGKLEMDKLKGDKEEKRMREILWLVVREIDGQDETPLGALWRQAREE